MGDEAGQEARTRVKERRPNFGRPGVGKEQQVAVALCALKSKKTFPIWDGLVTLQQPSEGSSLFDLRLVGQFHLVCSRDTFFVALDLSFVTQHPSVYFWIVVCCRPAVVHQIRVSRELQVLSVGIL